MGRELIEERGKAAGTIAEQLAVEVHAGAVVDALEIDVEATTVGEIAAAHGQVATVPSDAAWQVTLTRAAVGRHGLGDTPVVGQTNVLPAAVVVGGADGRGIIGELKEPAVIQEACIAKASGGLGCDQAATNTDGEKEEEGSGFHKRGVCG